MSRTKAFVKDAIVGIQLPPDGGFTVYIDEFGNAVCGTPPWVKTQATLTPKEPIFYTQPYDTPDNTIGHGKYILSDWPTPFAPHPDKAAVQPQAQPVPGPIVPEHEPADVYDPIYGDDTKEAIVCFIPPGTVHEYLPEDLGTQPAPLPPVQPADLNDQGPPDVLYDPPIIPAPPEYPFPEGPWSGPYPVPEAPWTGPHPVPEGPWSGPYPIDPIHTMPVEPAVPLTIDSEGTISHNPINPDSPISFPIDLGDDDIQAAINDFVHSSTVKEVTIKDIANVAQPVPVAPDLHDTGIMPPEHGPRAPEVFI